MTHRNWYENLVHRVLSGQAVQTSTYSGTRVEIRNYLGKPILSIEGRVSRIERFVRAWREHRAFFYIGSNERTTSLSNDEVQELGPWVCTVLEAFDMKCPPQNLVPILVAPSPRTRPRRRPRRRGHYLGDTRADTRADTLPETNPGRRIRRNGDEEIRALERAVAQGDEQAERRLAHLRIRAGVSDKADEVGAAVIRRGPLFGWTFSWEFPGVMQITPPSGHGAEFHLAATPYWDGHSGVPVQVTGNDGRIYGDIGYLELPETDDVVAVALFYRSKFAELVSSAALVSVQRAIRAVEHSEAQGDRWPELSQDTLDSFTSL